MNSREAYVVKETCSNEYLLTRNPIKYNPWKKGEVPVELVRFFPDVTAAKQAGSNLVSAVKEDGKYKTKYKIIKVRLSMEEIEEVFERKE